MYKEYQAIFESEQPEVGVQCPKCQEGYIEGNDFTGKDGKKWYSVKCEKCLTKWLSKFESSKPRQTEGQIQKENKKYDIFDVPEENKLMKEMIIKTNTRIDKLVIHLQEKGVIDK